MNGYSTEKLVRLALLSAIAVILHMIESTYIGPFYLNVRFGIANVAALLAWQMFGLKEMWIVNLLRVLLSAVLRGTIFGSSFWISCGGVLLASLTICLLDRIHASLIFTSILSSIMHTTGQIIVVSLMYRQARMGWILAVMILASIVTGVLTGMTASLALQRLKKRF